jgi:outer membrane biosynthesis protein TonB
MLNPPFHLDSLARRYEDDFEEDADSSPRLGPNISALPDDLLSSSLSIVDPGDDDEEEEEPADPSLYQARPQTPDKGAGAQAKFERKDVSDAGSLVRKDDAEDGEDGDVVEFGDATCDAEDDALFKKFVDDIAMHFMEDGGRGEGAKTPGESLDLDLDVRESISKDFLKGVGKEASGGDEDELEKSLAPIPDTSLKQEREAMKLTEKKQQTADAVEKMREQLNQMGIIGMNTQELNMRPTTAEAAGRAEEPAAEPVVEPVAEPVAEPVEEPAKELVVEPAKELVAEPATEPVEKPGEEPSKEPVEEPAKEVADSHSPTPSPSMSLTVDTSLVEENAGDDSTPANNMFLSPATTNCSTEKSLAGLSFTNTGELATPTAETTAEAYEAGSPSDDFVHVSPPPKAEAEVGAEEVTAEEPKEVEAGAPIPSISPVNNSGDRGNAEVPEPADKENVQSQPCAAPKPAPLHKPPTPPNVLDASESMSSSVALRRPPTEYKRTLVELNSAMNKAFALYEELLEQSMGGADETSSAGLEVGSESLDASSTFESCELLNSFRESFATLNGKMAVLNDKDKTNTSIMRNSFVMPSILEDSAVMSGGQPLMSQSVTSNDWAARAAGGGAVDAAARPSTAPANDLNNSGRNEADLLDGVLEKYSDILLAKMMDKMSKSGTLPTN